MEGGRSRSGVKEECRNGSSREGGSGRSSREGGSGR